MGNLVGYCDCNRQKSNKLLSQCVPLIVTRKSSIKQQNNKNSKKNKIIYFNELSQLFPYKYLGNGLYGTSLQVFIKNNKSKKFVQKIVPCENLKQNYLFSYPQKIEDIIYDSILSQKIVKIHAYQILQKQKSNKLYQVMDKMEKGDLYFHLCRLDKKNGRYFHENAIKRIAYEILQILERLHQKRIIYKNLRPQNIFVQQNGKLAVSQILLSIYHNINQQNNNHNHKQNYYGAAEYSPPEMYHLHKKKKTKITKNDNHNKVNVNNLNEYSKDFTSQRQWQKCYSPSLPSHLNLAKQLLTKSLDLKQIGLSSVNKKDSLQQQQTRSPQLITKKSKLMRTFTIIQQNHDLQNKINLTGKTQSQLDKEKQNDFLRNAHEKILKIQKQKYSQKQIKMSNLNPKKSVSFFLPAEQSNSLFKAVSSFKNKDNNNIMNHNFQTAKYLNEQTKQIVQHSDQQSSSDTQFSFNNKINKQQKSFIIDYTIDTWMLGVMLFQLIYGTTSFEKWKGNCQLLSKISANDDNQHNVKELQKIILHKNVNQIWYNLTSPASCSISQEQKNFIQTLLTKQKSQRKTIKQLKSHLFLQNAQKLQNTHILELIYEQNYKNQMFQKDMKYSLNHKDSNLMASRTVLKKIQHKSNYQIKNLSLKVFAYEDNEKKDNNQEQ